jgi:hypothetical protein
MNRCLLLIARGTQHLIEMAAGVTVDQSPTVGALAQRQARALVFMGRALPRRPAAQRRAAQHVEKFKQHR